MRLRFRGPLPAWPVVLIFLALFPVSGRSQQSVEYGGHLSGAGLIYPIRPTAADTRFAATSRLWIWATAATGKRLRWRGSLDFRLDSHHDVDRSIRLDLSQRGLRQPAVALDELYADVRLGRMDLRIGKQKIRWGRADGFNPTDNIIPYDYLDTFSEERLAIPAVKTDFYAGGARFEAVWIPFHTPTRLPRLGQRWYPSLPSSALVAPSPGLPAIETGLVYRDGQTNLPARSFGNSQWGVRWNQILPRGEFSFSYFDGHDDIASFEPVVEPFMSASMRPRLLVSLNRAYDRLKVAGADFATSVGPVGLRGEAAFFDQTGFESPDHLLFVVGVDRSWGDWFAIVQYAGQKVSGNVSGAIFPNLGLRSTLLYRIERTLGPSRTVELKGAIRLRDGDFLLQPSYNVALSNRWRFKLGATILGGSRNEYLGQFRDNGNLLLEVRYTF